MKRVGGAGGVVKTMPVVAGCARDEHDFVLSAN